MNLEQPGPTQKPKEEEISLKEISELKEPLQRIIEQIQGRIESGEYGLVIGDDASGRIPALILGNFIKEVSKSKGVPDPKIIFIPGNPDPANATADLLQGHLAKYGVKKDNRILVVTEAIKTGGALKSLSRSLKESGFKFDIATIGIEKGDDDEEEHDLKMSRESNLSGAIISGNYFKKTNYTGLSHTPLVYKSGASGVFHGPGDLKTSSIKSIYEDKPETAAKVQQRINESRVQINILVDQLLDWYQIVYPEDKNRKI